MAVSPVSSSVRPASADGFPYNGDFADPAFIRTYVASLARDADSMTKGIASAKTLDAYSALALKLDSRISSLLEHPGTLDADTLHIRLELLQRFRVVLRSAEHKDAATSDKKSAALIGDIKIFLDRQVTRLPKAEQAAALTKVDDALKAIGDGLHALNAGLHAQSAPAVAAGPTAAPDGGAPTTTAPAIAPKVIKLPNTAGRFSPKDWRDITETFKRSKRPRRFFRSTQRPPAACAIASKISSRACRRLKTFRAWPLTDPLRLFSPARAPTSNHICVRSDKTPSIWLAPLPGPKK